jgi:hypothetical protein
MEKPMSETSASETLTTGDTGQQAPAGGSPIERATAIAHRLDDPELDPDPARTFATTARAKLDAVTVLLEELVAPLEAATGAGAGAEAREEMLTLRARVSWMIGEVAAVLQSARDPRAAAWLARASALSPDEGGRDFFTAAGREPEGLARVVRVHWLRRTGRWGQAERLARQAIKRTREPLLVEAARRAFETPRPVDRAPALFTLNGCGVTLYGHRDDRPDGSYVATYFITLLFVPLVPLGAYRVVSDGGTGYYFLGKVPLGPMARGWRALLALGLVASILSGGVGSYLGSPSRQAARAIAEVQARERGRAPEQVLEDYQAVLRTHGDAPGSALAPAAVAMVRLMSAQVPRPFTADHVRAAEAAVARLHTLSPAVREGEPSRAMIAQLSAWSSQIAVPAGGPERLSALEARLALARLAAPLGDAGDRLRLQSQQADVATELGQALAADWPVEALGHLAEGAATSSSARQAAVKLLGEMVKHPALLAEASNAITALRGATGSPELAAASATAASVLAAWTTASADPARQQALAGSEAAPLEEQLKARPDDQELAVALAGLEAGKGQTAAAIARLTALGAISPDGPGRVGWTIGRAQLLLASLWADGDKPLQAEALLERYVAARLPGFRQAAQAYSQALTAAENEHLARARRGELPAEMRSQLDSPSLKDEQKRELVRAWLLEQLNRDTKVAARRAAYAEHAGVVPAVLTLGRVKLQRANAQTGAARQKLLGEAERTFLSVQQQAEGQPQYHLMLGQVYYRLNKTDDGARQFAVLLGKNDPEQTLLVARSYYHLGIYEKGRQLSEAVHASAGEPLRTHAAVLRALMSTGRQDRETWLKKGNPDDAQVKLPLRELEADRLAEEGRYAEADRILAEIAADYERGAAHQAALANNAALALQSRAAVSGDGRHLVKAAELLESALRASPDSGIITGNLADVLQYQARLRVLDRLVPVDALRLSSGDAAGLLSALLGGRESERVRTLLREEPLMARVRQLLRTYETLTPQSPSSYEQQMQLFEDLRDDQALAQLAERIGKVQLETGFTGEARRRWQDGSEDVRLRELMMVQVDRARRRVEKLGQASAASPPRQRAARGAALVLLAQQLHTRFGYFGDTADADAVVKLGREAEALWPAAHISVESALLTLALARAGENSAGLSALWKERRRLAGATELLQRMLSHPDLAELRRRPELAAAAKAARLAVSPQGDRPAARRPSLYDWLLAKVAQDAGLLELARPAFARADILPALTIEAAVRPDTRNSAEMMTLYRSQGR